MSLVNTTTKVKYSGDGANTTFAITFDFILNNSECKVVLRDETDPLAITETLQVDGVDYNLTGASPPSIPFPTNVEMVVAPTATQELVVHRSVPLSQLLDYLETSQFRAESQELGLDKLTAIVQEITEQLTRTPGMSIGTDANLPVSYPEPAANNFVGWDDEGDDLRNYTAAEIVEEVVGLVLLKANNLSDVADAPTSATNLGLGAGDSVTHNDLTLVANLSAVDVLASGKLDSATQVDFETFLDTTGIATPATPAAGRFKIYMKSDGELYKINDAGLETGVGGGGSSFIDTLFRIQDDVDQTKEIAFEATNITTGTVRTITMPDADVDLTADSAVAGSFANRQLDNLGTTAINADLLPDGDNTRDLGAPSNRWSLIHGTNIRADGGDLFLRSANGFQTYLRTQIAYSMLDAGLASVFKSNDPTSARLGLVTQSESGTDNTADLLIETGRQTGSAGNSGGIRLTIGSSANGTQGEFRVLKEGVAPTVGDVFTCTNVNGEGYWAAPSAAGGGAGGLKWQELGSSPAFSNEFDAENYLYESGIAQNLYTQIEVPPSYVAANPVAMRINWYSPDTSGTGLLRAEATLIRPGTDAFGSVVNQRTTTNAAVTLAVANNLNTESLDLTSGIGEINAIAISPGDKIKIRLYRDTDTGTSDLRFVPGIVGVSFE